MYVDKLDDVITQEFFDQKCQEWRKEQSEILEKIGRHQHANAAYLDEGVKLLELSQQAVLLYDQQPMHEKRRLLNLVGSNSVWKDGCL